LVAGRVMSELELRAPSGIWRSGGVSLGFAAGIGDFDGPASESGRRGRSQNPHPSTSREDGAPAESTAMLGLRLGGPEEAEVGGARAKCLSLVARVAWRSAFRAAAKQSA
jgi:hypothetical protein